MYPISFLPGRKLTNTMIMYYTNSTCEKVIITAIDILPSGSSPKFKQQLQAALDKHKPESTGGLPKVITVAINHQYDMI